MNKILQAVSQCLCQAAGSRLCQAFIQTPLIHSCLVTLSMASLCNIPSLWPHNKNGLSLLWWHMSFEQNDTSVETRIQKQKQECEITTALFSSCSFQFCFIYFVGYIYGANI